MKTKKSISKKTILIMVGFILIAAVAVKLMNNRAKTLSKVYTYDKDQPVSVQTITLKNDYVSSADMFAGTFEPVRETKVSAEIQGKINIMFVDLGSYVTKGQPLVQLDNSLLKLQLQATEVQIEGLQDDVNRYTILAGADAIQGVQLEKASLGLKTAQIQKATLQEQINKTTIRAPFSGVVTARFNEEGAFAAPGMPLLQITDISELKFTIQVGEKDLARFTPNNLYPVTADTYAEVPLHGRVVMIGSKANMGNSFPVQFLVRNTSDSKIKSGMFGKAYLNETSSEKGILIPTSSITGSQNQAKVYVVRDGKAVLQNITVSKSLENSSVVSSGLNEGDVLITQGLINLFEGANVKIK